MVHLEYNFKKYQQERDWENSETNWKFMGVIAYLKTQGIKKMRVFDKNGVNIRHDVAGFHDKYIEVNYKEFIVKLRHLTYESDKYVKDMNAKIMEMIDKPFKIPMLTQPCNRCGKTQGWDFDGVCMDCADTLKVSEIWITDPKYDEYFYKSRHFFNSYREKLFDKTTNLGSGCFEINPNHVDCPACKGEGEVHNHD